MVPSVPAADPSVAASSSAASPAAVGAAGAARPTGASALDGRARVAVLAYGLASAVALPIWGAEAASKAISSGYDWANRLYALPLLCLVVYLGIERLRTRSRTAAVALAGAIGMLAGVVLEFGLGALQSKPLSDDAHRRGLPGSSVWWGSNVGFALYGIGLLILAVGGIAYAVALRGQRTVLQTLAVAVLGVLPLVSFAAKDGGALPAAIVGLLVFVDAGVLAVDGRSR